MSVQLIHIQAFLAVADTLSFRTAAAKLYLAPSRLSERVQEAEAELGAPLFERTTRRTSMTAAGHALLPRARAIVRELETIEAIFRTHTDRALHVGVRSLPQDFRDRFLTDVLRPAVAPQTVAPQPRDSDLQMELLRSGVLDLALAWDKIDNEAVDQIPVLREEIVIAVPASPRFTRLDAVTPEDVIGLRLASTIDPRRWPTAALYPCRERNAQTCD